MSVLQDIKDKLFRQEGQEQADPTPRNAPATVTMYSTRFCPFCMRARALLQKKEVAYKDVAVDGNPALREEMIEISGRYTVPQIWIGKTHIGGCDELMQLERTGELDRMLFDATGANNE